MRRKFALLLAVLLVLSCLSGCGGKKEEVITSVEQLNDGRYTVGVGMGTADVHAVEENLPKAEMIEYSSVSNGYLAVKAGMLDAFAYGRDSMQYALASGGLKGVKMLDESVGEGVDVVVGISPKTAIPDLKQKTNAFIAAIHADGTFDEMYTRWVVNASEDMPEIPKPEHPDYKIVVGTSGAAVPFSYYKGSELIGMDLEMIARFANYLNAEVEIVTLDYLSLSAASEAGTLDCIFANLHATPERAEIMDFSDPVYKFQTAIMVRGESGDAASTRSLADYDGKKIGVLTGSIHEAIAQEKFPNAEISYYESSSDMAIAVGSGIIDGFSCALSVAKEVSSADPSLTHLDEPLGKNSCAFAFGRTEDGKILCEQMSAYIRKLEAERALEKKFSEWDNDTAADIDTSDLPTNGRTLTFATSGSNKPFSYVRDGKVVGYDVELAVGFCREYGYNIKIETLNFDGIISGLASGMYDFAGDSIVITEERAQSVLFSDPYYTAEIVLVVKEDESGAKKPRYVSMSEMQGSDIKIGIEVGSCFEKLALESFPNAQFSYYDAMSDMPLSISSGELDGFVCDEPIARLIAAKKQNVTYIPESLGNNEYAFAFPKTEEGRQLCDQVSEFIRKLRSDGTLKEIETAWLDDDVSRQLTDRSDLTGENGTIRVATVGNPEPFCFTRDGQSVGFDLDILTRFCREYGYGLEVYEMNLAAIIPSLGTTCDVGANGLCPTPERLEAVYFSEPYYEAGGVIMVGTEEKAPEGTGGFWQSMRDSFEKTFIREQRWKLIVEGIGTTIFISLFSIVFGTLLGFGVCMLRRMNNPVTHALTTGYIRILQGTPIVVLLMVMFYLVFPGAGLSGSWVAVVAFSLNFAAYVSEMMRTAIEAVDVGQTEAALALGFTKSRTFFKFIVPQAMRQFLPVYKGECISLVKTTSVVGYIAVKDLTKMSDIIRARTYEAFFPLIATALIYFTIAALMTSLLRLLDVKTEPDRRKRIVKGVKMQ